MQGCGRSGDRHRHGARSVDIRQLDQISVSKGRHRAAEFRNFLIKTNQEVPAHLQIYLIGDNYGTHKTRAIWAWMAKQPVPSALIPTESSWINPD
ncbi:transposase [Kribbella deserti]|uniref:Transposase n=1 Tax=Kribbella deserti TaxID=1926257 RepID=A0ABV6QN27_9ACTN